MISELLERIHTTKMQMHGSGVIFEIIYKEALPRYQHVATYLYLEHRLLKYSLHFPLDHQPLMMNQID